LFTIMVIDAWGNGIPVGWFVAGGESAVTVAEGLRAWLDAVRRVPGQEDFMPSCALVDDSAAEHAALRYTLVRLLVILNYSAREGA
jgi:hypothetical protein